MAEALTEHSSLVSGWVRMLSLGMKPESKCGPYLVLGSKTGKTGFFFSVRYYSSSPLHIQKCGSQSISDTF